jgi:RNA polymerase sigma factor (sigma-70 family)
MQHDSTLVDAARQGDIVAVEQLLAACRPDLARLAHTQCAAGVDADDTVQESLLLIYRRIGALRTIASFPVWTFSIVRRECHRLWRVMRGPAEVPAADHPALAYTDQLELRNDLAAAIQSLPEKYREAIIVRFRGILARRDRRATVAGPRGREKPYLSRLPDAAGISEGLMCAAPVLTRGAAIARSLRQHTWPSA